MTPANHPKMERHMADQTLTLTLETGDVVIKLRPDLAPGHVARITELASEGFHTACADRQDTSCPTCSALLWPMTMREQRARVRPTLMRRSSATKPMPPLLRPFFRDLQTEGCGGKEGRSVEGPGLLS